MAHLNIDIRRKEVFKLLDKYGFITYDERKPLCKKYSCSNGAIYSDMAQYYRKSTMPIYASIKTKKHIFNRDGNFCQYCLKSTKTLIAEHVIPFIFGGSGEEYNLVASCISCNSYKRGKV